MAETTQPGFELVQQLLERQAETRNLDYKAAMSFGPTKVAKADMLKCLMAFANTRDGGYMLFGVNQVGGQFVPTGVWGQQADSFDPTNIGAFAQNYCSVLPRVSTRVVRFRDVDLLLLTIEEFEDEPIVCTRDFHDGDGQQILRAGSIYVRTVDARCVAIDSGEAMRALLDLAVQKRGDALLGQIRALVSAPQAFEAPAGPSPYAAQLEAAHVLFDREQLVSPYWSFDTRPLEYDPERISSNARLREVRQEAEVSIRGWNFPHTDREYDRAFENGIESVTHWGRYHEAHRLYHSGLFSWRRRLAEDLTESYQGGLSYQSTIYSITEVFTFASRYAALTLDRGDVVMDLGLVGLHGRQLVTGPEVILHAHPTAANRFERSLQVSLEALRSSYLDFAAETCRQLFGLFNVDVPLDAIRGWQERFISRQF